MICTLMKRARDVRYWIFYWSHILILSIFLCPIPITTNTKKLTHFGSFASLCLARCRGNDKSYNSKVFQVKFSKNIFHAYTFIYQLIILRGRNYQTPLERTAHVGFTPVCAGRSGQMVWVSGAAAAGPLCSPGQMGRDAGSARKWLNKEPPAFPFFLTLSLCPSCSFHLSLSLRLCTHVCVCWLCLSVWVTVSI